MSGTATYPNLLAGGVANEGAFLPFELWAGESDLVTSQGTAAVNLQQFQVIERDAQGRIIPWRGLEGTAGTDTITFTALPAAGDTVTINGQVVTFRATGATGLDINLPANVTLLATALASEINANEDVFAATATSSAGVVTVSASEAGDVGNTVTVAKNSANITVGSATMAGGTPGRRAIGFMAQAAVAGGPAVFYTGGVPNHLALVWPPGVTTLDQRKAAFDGTNITVSALL